MNLSLAFFHGEQAFVGLLFAAFIVLLGFPLLVYVWLRHTKLSERIPALVYFIVTASACAIVLGAHDPASVPLLTIFYMGFISTVPWNVITIIALYVFRKQYMSNHEVAFVMLMAAGINTMLLYFLAKELRRLVK